MSDGVENGDLLSTVEDEDFLSSAEILRQLNEAWLNETLSPELLPPRSELVDCVLAHVDNAVESIPKIAKTDFGLPLYKLEVERLKYVVTSYLRCRIKKIQKHAFYIASLVEKRRATDPPLVTPEEEKFLSDYISATSEHFDVLALKRFPPNISALRPSEVNISFPMNQCVFVKVLKESPNVLVEDTGSNVDIDVELRAGSRHLLPYKHIASLVHTRNVALI